MHYRDKNHFDKNPLGWNPLNRHLCWLLPLLALLAGCESSLGPMSWESGYHQVGTHGEPLKGSEGIQQQLIIPNTCRTQPEESGVVTLPPGCANDLNLQLMVERPGDLLRGREMGPAQAGPVANAAREYLQRRERAHERRRQLEWENRDSISRNASTSDL